MFQKLFLASAAKILFCFVFLTKVQSFQTLPIAICQQTEKNKDFLFYVAEKNIISSENNKRKKLIRNDSFGQKGNFGPKKKRYQKNRGGGANYKFRELNQKITSCKNAEEVLSLIASTPGALTKTSGGGALNNVNFSTSIHRIARYVGRKKDERVMVLSDPKFALLICSFAEALTGKDPKTPLSSLKEYNSSQLSNFPHKFSSRETANLVWSLAKLRIAPPVDALPIRDKAIVRREILETSLQLRNEIVNFQRTGDKTWISKLSLLAAQLMDTVADMLFESDFETVNTQEIVNSLWSFSTAQRPSAAVFNHLGSILATKLERMKTPPKPQELSIAIWAYGTAKVVTGSQQRILEQLSTFLEDSDYLNTFKSQELANTAWGISTLINLRRESGEANNGTPKQEREDLLVCKILRRLAKAIIERCNEYTSQEVSNTIYAFGVLGFGIGAENAERQNLNDYIILKSDDFDGDEKLINQVLRSVEKSVMRRLETFKEQELNNLAYGCARIIKKQPNLFMGIANEFSYRYAVSGQDVATTLWAFATTKFFEPVAFEKMLSTVRIDKIHYFKPQEISNLIWAIGTAEMSPKYQKAFDTTLIPKNELETFEEYRKDPITLTMRAAANELQRRPEEFKAQEIKDLLWGFSKAGVRHPLLFRFVAQYLVGRPNDLVPVSQLHTGVGLNSFSSQEIGNLCWAFAKQAQLASGNSDLTGRMAIYCSMSVDTGEVLLKRLANCAAEAYLTQFRDLSRVSTNDLSNTLWSFSALGFRFDRFIDIVINQVVTRCYEYTSGNERNSRTTFLGQELANILWSLALLNAVTPEVLDTIEPYIILRCGDGSAASIAKYLNRAELGNIAWSCTIADHYPPRLVRLLQRGLIGEGLDEQNPKRMNEVHKDEGLKEQGVITLIYLHYGMELSRLPKQIELPPDFPNDWGVSQEFDLLEDEFGISPTLKTSKMQQNVANAFSRIGMEFVEEYIVQSPGRLPDYLSLDIADPLKKIGIEVDGPSHYYHSMKDWSPHDPPTIQRDVRIKNGQSVEYRLDWNGVHNKENGPTLLKSRLLKVLGWKIIRIPFWEWFALNGDKTAEEEYCCKALRNINRD